MNIEEHFRQSFEDVNFEFKEEYWLGAKKLLDKEFAQRLFLKRMAIAASLILLLSTGSIYYILYDGSNQAVMVKEMESSPSEYGTAQPPGENHLSNIQKNNNTIHENIITKTSPESLPQVHENIKLHREQFSITEKSEKAEHQQLNIGQEHLSSNDKIEKQSTQLVQNQLQEELQDNRANQIVNELEQKSIAEIQPSGQEDAQIAFFQKTDMIPSLNTRKVKRNSDYYSVFAHNPFGHTASIGTFSSISPALRSTTYLGTEVFAFPSLNNHGFNYIGYSASVQHQIMIKNNIFLETGILGTMRTGDFSPSVQSIHLSYDFGSRENAFLLRPREIYSLQVPVYFGVNMKRHQLSAGVTLAGLIGVRGTHEYQLDRFPWEDPTTNVSGPYQQIANGWLSSDGFRNYTLSYGLRYSLHLNRMVLLSVSVQYRPRDWVDDDFGSYFDIEKMEYVLPDLDLTNPLRRNLILGLGIRYGFYWKN